MARAIITAPVARDLAAEHGRVWKIPNASNGTLQAWCTNAREYFLALADAELTIYTRRADIPNALRPYLVAVRRSDTTFNPSTGAGATNIRWKQLGICGAGDYFRVRASDGTVSVKLRSELVAGDRPVDWTPIHFWLGVADDLGED